MSFTTLASVLVAPATLVLAAAAKGALLIALAFVATHLLRHRSAAIRHAIWASAVLGHLVLLLALPFVPRMNVPLIPAATWSAPVEAPQSSRVETAAERTAPATDAAAPPAASERIPIATTATAPVQPQSNRPSLATLLIAAWLIGAMAVLARYIVGTARVARLARESERVADGNWLSLAHGMAISMGIARPLTLIRGGQLDVPVTWGILYPVVFLPAEADKWPEERQRFVLVHELAHVKRMDAATQLLTQITAALFWFDPLVWYAAGRIRAERERACDDQVLLHGVRPSLYADELLDMVRAMTPRRYDPAPAFAALAMARRSEFEGRMLAILDPHAARTALSRTARLATLAAALLLMLPLAAFRPVRAASAATIDAAAIPAAPASSAQAGTPAVAPGSAAPAPSDAAASPMYKCTPADLNSTGQQISVHGHADDNNSAASYTEVLMRSPGHCAFAILVGNVTLARDLTDVAVVAPGARAVFRELVPGMTRELTVARSASGSLERTYTENSRPADPARAAPWLSELIRALVLKGGFGVPERVAQLRASSGVSAVLEEASQAPSSGVKRRYLDALLRTQPRLTQTESDRVLQQAAAEITSSGDLRRVIEAAVRHGSPSASAVSAAVARVQSDGDRRAVITTTLRNSPLISGSSMLNPGSAQPDPEIMRTLLRAAATIGSDGDKAAVLIEAAPHAFGSEAVRTEFYNAVATIASSGDRRRVLITAARHAPRDADAVRQFLSATAGVTSDGDKAAVLIAAIRVGMAGSDGTREAFMLALRGIESDGEKSRVLRALLR